MRISQKTKVPLAQSWSTSPRKSTIFNTGNNYKCNKFLIWSTFCRKECFVRSVNMRSGWIFVVVQWINSRNQVHYWLNHLFMYSMDIMGPNLWVSVYKSYGRYDSSASWPFVLEHWTDSFKTKVNIFIGSAAKVVAVPNAPHKHLNSINPNEISHKEDSFSPVSISKVFSLTTHQKKKQTTHTQTRIHCEH